MASRSVRIGVCGVVGLFAGLMIGFMIAPDPTGLLGPALGIALGAVIGVALYQTGVLREDADVAG